MKKINKKTTDFIGNGMILLVMFMFFVLVITLMLGIMNSVINYKYVGCYTHEIGRLKASETTIKCDELPYESSRSCYDNRESHLEEIYDKAHGTCEKYGVFFERFTLT